MKRFIGATMVLAALMGIPAFAGQDLEWDNFPITGDFPLGYDTTNRFTSERDTQHSSGISAASWAIDDFHIPLGDQPLGEDQGDEQVVLNNIEWVGVRELFDRPGFGYDRLDYVILTRTFDPFSGLYDFQPLQYGQGQQALFLNQQVGTDWQIEEELGNVSPTLFTYRGSVAVPDIPLEPQVDYWVGLRLVGNDGNDDGGTGGRHFIPSASGHPESVDGAFRYDPPRGGDPWQRIQSPFSSDPFEAAYRLGMTVVPEPATLFLLLVGGLMVGRSRK
jgi:hypothetical protein